MADTYALKAYENTERETAYLQMKTEEKLKRYKPWRFREVPVGALVRLVDNGGSCVLWESLICTKIRANNKLGWSIYIPHKDTPKYDLGLLHTFDRIQHSVDGGKTWLRCGSEVVQ